MTLESLLNNHNIEIGCFIYSYQPIAIDWWNPKQPTGIEINIGQFEEDGSSEVLIWLGDEDNKELVFQSTWLDQTVKRTFLSDLLAKRFNLIEFERDEEQEAWTTDSFEDTFTILKNVFSELETAELADKSPGDPYAYKEPEEGDCLRSFVDTLEANDIDNDEEQIRELMMMLVEHEGLGLLLYLRQELGNAAVVESIQTGSGLLDTIQQVNQSYVRVVLASLKTALNTTKTFQWNDQNTAWLLDFLTGDITEENATLLLAELGVEVEDFMDVMEEGDFLALD